MEAALGVASINVHGAANGVGVLGLHAMTQISVIGECNESVCFLTRLVFSDGL